MLLRYSNDQPKLIHLCFSVLMTSDLPTHFLLRIRRETTSAIRRLGHSFDHASLKSNSHEYTSNSHARKCTRVLTCVCRGVNWIKQHATSSVYTAGSVEVKLVIDWPLIHHVVYHRTPIHRLHTWTCDPPNLYDLDLKNYFLKILEIMPFHRKLFTGNNFLLSKSESVKFSLIELVIRLFTDSSVKKYF